MVGQVYETSDGDTVHCPHEDYKDEPPDYSNQRYFVVPCLVRVKADPAEYEEGYSVVRKSDGVVQGRANSYVEAAQSAYQFDATEAQLEEISKQDKGIESLITPTDEVTH